MMKRPRPDRSPRRSDWRPLARRAVLAAVDLSRLAGWILWLSLGLLSPVLFIWAVARLVAGAPAGALSAACCCVVAAVVHEWLRPGPGPDHEHLGGTTLSTPEFDRSPCFLKPR